METKVAEYFSLSEKISKMRKSMKEHNAELKRLKKEIMENMKGGEVTIVCPKTGKQKTIRQVSRTRRKKFTKKDAVREIMNTPMGAEVLSKLEAKEEIVKVDELRQI
jgi:ABC-type proline/glycine betaine transport system substrate-binding protein